MEVMEILTYPLNLLNFCGCFVPLTSEMTHLGDVRLPPRSDRTRNIVMTSYRIFLALLHTANCLRCFAFEVYFLQHFNSRLAFYFQWNLLVIFGILVYVLESILCRFYLKPVLTGLKNYGTIFGYKNNLHRTNKFIRIVSYISIVGVFILTLVTNSVHMFWTHDEKPFFIYPFHDKEGLEFFVGGYLVTAITPFSYLTICGFFILYSVIVEIVSNEFVGSRDEMDHALNTLESLQDTEAAFLRASERHHSLCEIVTNLSNLTRIFAAESLIASISVVFFAIYALSSGQMSQTQVANETVVVVLNTFLILYLCFRWGRLPAAAASIAQVLKSRNLYSKPSEFLHKVHLFMSECSMNKTGIDVFGVFTIDCSMALMVFGTIVTYGVVVLQLQLQQSPSQPCSCGNSTL